MKKSLIVKKAYKTAKKSIEIDRKRYYLYCALSRAEKDFNNLIPLFKEEKNSIKILLDIASDICLVYGSKEILKLLKKEHFKNIIKK